MYIPQTILVCDALDVGSTSTYYSNSFEIGFGSNFGIWYKAASAGTIALKIELEESYTKPATEGSSDSNWGVPSGLSDIVSNLANNTLDMKTVAPVPMRYGRLKITGLTGNAASTTLTARVLVQEQA